MHVKIDIKIRRERRRGLRAEPPTCSHFRDGERKNKELGHLER